MLFGFKWHNMWHPKHHSHTPTTVGGGRFVFNYYYLKIIIIILSNHQSSHLCSFVILLLLILFFRSKSMNRNYIFFYINTFSFNICNIFKLLFFIIVFILQVSAISWSKAPYRTFTMDYKDTETWDTSWTEFYATYRNQHIRGSFLVLCHYCCYFYFLGGRGGVIYSLVFLDLAVSSKLNTFWFILFSPYQKNVVQFLFCIITELNLLKPSKSPSSQQFTIYYSDFS